MSSGRGLFIFMTYQDKLKDPRWQKKRLLIFNRDNWRCCYCADENSTLHVHHDEYEGNDPWDTPANLLKCVCQSCHFLLEAFKKGDPGITVCSIKKIESTKNKGNYLFVIKLIEDDCDEQRVAFAALQEESFNIFPYLTRVHIDFIMKELEGL